MKQLASNAQGPQVQMISVAKKNDLCFVCSVRFLVFFTILVGLLSESIAEDLSLPSRLEIPDRWTCDSSKYGAEDGCDCLCGSWDPDCIGDGAIKCGKALQEIIENEEDAFIAGLPADTLPTLPLAPGQFADREGLLAAVRSCLDSDATGRVCCAEDPSCTRCEEAGCVELKDWDVSRVTNMYALFHKASEFSGDLSQWDTSQVRNMRDMFKGASSFNSNLSQWNVNQVTDMGNMFAEAWVFNGDLSQWDVSQVRTMEFMFYKASDFSGDLSQWDVSQVTDMQYMFSGASAFNGDLSQWDTSQVTNVQYMFSGASAFNSDLSQWDVRQVTNMHSMFKRAKNFNQDLSVWNVSQVNDMHSMFSSASVFTSDLSQWDVGQVLDMGGTFQSASAFDSSLSLWDVGQVRTMQKMFYKASKFGGDLSQWDVGQVRKMGGMFDGASNFEGDLSQWNVSQVTDMQNMFSGATAFDGDLSRWNVSQVNDMQYMFSRASNFQGDISQWDVGQVDNMRYMFSGALKFNEDLSQWVVSHVTDMQYMFSGAAAFNGDISQWNVTQVTDMQYMFSGASNFVGDLSEWDLNQTTSVENMFSEASAWIKTYRNCGYGRPDSTICRRSVPKSASRFSGPPNAWVLNPPSLESRQVSQKIVELSIGIAIALVVMLFGLIFLMIRQHTLRKSRSLKATKEAIQLALLESMLPANSLGKDMCFVLTDVESSTILRIHSLPAYDEATQVHHNLLRQMLYSHGGVELLNEGDGFTLGFDTVSAGTAFCCDFQQALQDVAWAPHLQKVFRDIYKTAGSYKVPVCLQALKICATVPSRITAAQKELFNGLRVRCGVHWVTEGTYEVDKLGPKTYSISGPGYAVARQIGDVGCGGQIVLSNAAKEMLLCDLQAAKYPIITDLGWHRLLNGSLDELTEHLFQVAPSVGDLKGRIFDPIHTFEEVEAPHSHFSHSVARMYSEEGLKGSSAGSSEGISEVDQITVVAVSVNELKSFNEAIDRTRIPASTWAQVREVVEDMKRMFCGWRVNVAGGLDSLHLTQDEFRDTISKFDEDGSLREEENAIDVRQVMDLSASFRSQAAAGEAWLLAFKDPRDALRFSLSCCIDLAYSSWGGFRTWNGGTGSRTTDGGSLWSGPPLGFTMHTITRNSGHESLIDWVACRSVQGSRDSIYVGVGPELLELLAATRLIPANSRVVLSGSAWACLSEALGGQPVHFGKAVVEHLGTARMDCLSRFWDVYQILPVQLAARTNQFTSLRTAVPGHLSLQSPGARDAPPPTASLTFVFTCWYEPSERDVQVFSKETLVRRGKGHANLASDLQRIARECHSVMQKTCIDLGGYLVEEIGLCELMLAFPCPTIAASFACMAQCWLNGAALRSAPLVDAGLATLCPLIPLEEPLETGGDAGHPIFTGFLSAGIATVGSGRSQAGTSSHSAPKTSVLGLRLQGRAGAQAFASVHPITGRCTYSSPAINKAARAKTLARGGQVLLADLHVAEGQPGDKSLSRSWPFQWRFNSSKDLNTSTDSALHLPHKITVATSTGDVHAHLRPLDNVSFRGFREAIQISELVAELSLSPER